MERKNVFTEALADLKKMFGGIPKSARRMRNDKAKAHAGSQAKKVKRNRKRAAIAKQSRRVNRAA